MIVCPYKEMKNIKSLPCCREQKGKWIYCPFCGQKYQLDIPPDTTEQLIWVLLTAFMLVVLGRSIFVSNSSQKTPETSSNSDSFSDVSEIHSRNLQD